VGGSLIQLEPSANWRGGRSRRKERDRVEVKEENSRDIWIDETVRVIRRGVEAAWVEIGGERSCSSRGSVKGDKGEKRD